MGGRKWDRVDGEGMGSVGVSGSGHTVHHSFKGIVTQDGYFFVGLCSTF